MHLSPRALIDHAALRFNLAQARAHVPHAKVWAVIKADAYGHGAIEVAHSLAADGFAVARLDEAERLRAGGIKAPILVMGGVFSAEAVERAAALAFHIAIHDEAQLGHLERAKPAAPLPVWLKVNTGMNRLGVIVESAGEFLQRLKGCPQVLGQPGLMTHLANADDLSDTFSHRQCERLIALQSSERLPLCIANSAGVLAWRQARTDWVRPGIMLYGISPFLAESGGERALRPVMTLKASLIAINHCKAGERIGYGGTYQCKQDMPVGVLGIGYGDGYPRHAPTGTPVYLNGRCVPLLGRVSMDMITLDLRGIGPVQLGEEAILWGESLPAEEIAQAAGTIAYELLTGVTARVRREHINRLPAPESA